MRINFDDITPEVIRKITKEDINQFTGEEFLKYKKALDKYRGLIAIIQEESTIHDLIRDISSISENFNENTSVEIRVQSETGKDIYINTQYCKVKYEKAFNRVVITNYNSVPEK